MMPRWLILAGAVIVAALVSMAVHVPLQEWYEALLEARNSELAVIQWRTPTEVPWVMVLAWGTILLPTTGVMLVAVGLWEKLPGSAWWVKGISLGLLLLLVEGMLFRQPIMNAAVGNPLWAVFGNAVDSWGATMAQAMVLALGISFWKRRADHGSQ